jgi:hypothetical protein
MRFSSVFRHPHPPSEVRPEESAQENPQPVTLPGQELPDDLDARVRLIGEWQLGEG